MWPENARAVEVFCSLSSQWRVVSGMGGAHWQGLRYEVIPVVLRMKSVPRREWSEIFDALRVMEAAARESLNAR